MIQEQRGKLSPLLKQATKVNAVKGEGAYLIGDDGERYLDFFSGIGVNSTGHCHPKVVEAVQKQAATLIHAQYTTVKHPNILELSRRLGEKMPGDIDALFFASAGTEAVEAAMRLARQSTGKPNMIVFHGGFHGRTMGALSMTTSGVKLRRGLQPMMGGVVVAPFPDAYHYGWDEETTTQFCLRELDRIFSTYSAPEESAAFLVEAIQGDGGYIPGNKAFFEGLRERADKHNMLLIFDEVQAGYGRSGKFWALEHFGVQPDVVITAKGLASGFPLSAFGASTALMEKGLMGSQGGTYGGNAVSCAAALATLDVFEKEGLTEKAEQHGKVLRERLDALCKQYDAVDDVRGKGLMHGTVIVDENGNPGTDRVTKLLEECEENKVIFIRCGTYGEIVRWLPSLVVKEDEVNRAVDVFEAALKKI